MDKAELIRELRVDAEWLRAKCGPVGEQVAARIVRVAALLSEPGMVNVPGWIPVDERLPDDGESVLVYEPSGPLNSPQINKTCRYANDWILPHKSRVTHWMPLPESPLAAAKEKPI
jgi:hypothetical protein